jgi:long-chain-fatty-acid--[acyl-carrier-protein] ligase
MFYHFIASVCRLILKLRYRIDVKGMKELLSKDAIDPKKGILFLPNHPAHLDPLFVMLFFFPSFRMRPLVIEYVYRQRWLKGLMTLVGALPVPNFESSVNDYKLKKAEESLNVILKGLQKKEAFLLYPSGRLKHGAKEIIGGASATKSILEQCSDINIVLIRTTGLWGSSFSRAQEGKSPDIKKTVLKNLWRLCKNGLFFMPRRKVIMEIEVNPRDFPFKGSKIELNRYLEAWYNQYPVDHQRKEKEPLNLVSYSFYKKDLPKIAKLKKDKKESLELSDVPENITKLIREELQRLAGNEQKLELKPEMNLALDLGLDSLDIANLVAFLSDKCKVKQVRPENLETVADLLLAATGKMEKEEPVAYSSLSWPEEKNRLRPAAPCGKTLIESFFRSCERMRGFYCCADDRSGLFTYDKMKLAVIVLAQKIKQLPGDHIGIILPASVGSYLTILATMTAKKTPVMLNWTLGKKHLGETAKLAGVKVVISSWNFLEKLSYVEFGDLCDQIIFLEDIKQKVTLADKLKAFWCAKKSYAKIIDYFHLQSLSEDDTATILFTSGTETVPKGVPLTHRNILENEHAALQCVNLTAKDLLLGILPPFHSFGFSVAGIFPLLIGVKVTYFPDPTDGPALAESISRWKATILCSAPSFLKNIFQAGDSKSLKSLKLVVTGAEKAPSSLFELAEKMLPKATIIEGYGITECSPIISLNRVNQERKGVGQPIPGISVRTIHPETQQPLPEHAEGELCVHGPNVFKGYLGDRKSPFIDLDGKKWYRTGDLGYVDKKGNIILSGRLKRFAKVGGEMISLGAIEEILYDKLINNREEESLAVLVNEEDPEKSTLILFTTIDVDMKKVNDILREEGYSRIVKISAIQRLDAIPLTGTGKIDYRTLQSLANQT